MVFGRNAGQALTLSKTDDGQVSQWAVSESCQDSPSVDDLQLAESKAQEMSHRLNGEPVAVWGENDETLTLFAGFEQFKPV